MKIRYYCPECRKLSILNAVYTAEKRVCAWCGVTIHSEHVKEQTHYQRESFAVPLVLVGIVVMSISLKNLWPSIFFPSDSVLLERTWVQWWIMFLVYGVMGAFAWLALLVIFIELYYDTNHARDRLLDRAREKNKERAADQK